REGERHERAQRRADEAEAERPLLDAHRVAQFGEAGEDVAHGERIDGEGAEHLVLRRKLEAESHDGKHFRREMAKPKGLTGAAEAPRWRGAHGRRRSPANSAAWARSRAARRSSTRRTSRPCRSSSWATSHW